MDLGLAGAATVVVGGGRGMGLATAQCLADDGARVAIVGRSREVLDAAAVDLARRDLGNGLASDPIPVVLLGCNRAQVKQREPERRVHEGGLHIDRQQDAKPDQVYAHFVGHRPQQRHDNERQLEKVEEKGQHKGQQADHNQKAGFAARQTDQQMFHP